MNNSTTQSYDKETDYLVVGAGAMGIAFADEIFTSRPDLHMTLVDRRAKAGGHWNNAYPFVRLHQPAAFYGVNSLKLGNGSTDLSSQSELLSYYEQIIKKFEESGRVEFLTEHDYLGNGQVTDMHNRSLVTCYKINKRVVDASYMNVKVPSTHPPKFTVDQGVTLVPLNDLIHLHDKWEKFYVVGSGKTGMDAVLYLISKGVSDRNIYWICPNDAWLFNRSHLQVGTVGKEILGHVECVKNAVKADNVFLKMEKTGGILRLDKSISPKKWRCATVSPEELKLLRTAKNVIRKGRVSRITESEIQLEQGSVDYSERTLFVDCSADGLAKREAKPIFSNGNITLQSILFCQQVFSAATIAKLELASITDEKRNHLTPVPHPEFKEDWPGALSTSVENLLWLHRYIPFWMFRSRLNFMSHEPILKYFYYAAKATLLSPSIKKAVVRMKALQEA